MPNEPDVPVAGAGGGADVSGHIEAILRAAWGETQDPRRVLDAGCGAELPFRIPGATELVGIDISPDALALNTELDSAIVGDIQTYPLPPESFDLVICWNVLEHLPNPVVAVENMTRALRPGGILVLGLPNLWSLKGLLTRATPHRFHVWAYRRLLGDTDAGSPGHGPFPTYLRREIAPGRLVSLGRRHGLEPLYLSTYAVPDPLSGGLGAVWRSVLRVLRALSAGRWDPAASEHVAVLRRAEALDLPARAG